jgi:hypothetical protein
MTDLAAAVLLVVAFAGWVTAHVAIAFGLARRASVARALACAIVFPLAPYAAVRDGLRVRAIVWVAAAAAYGFAFARLAR